MKLTDYHKEQNAKALETNKRIKPVTREEFIEQSKQLKAYRETQEKNLVTSSMEEKPKPTKEEIEATFKSMEERGMKWVQKTGAIIMPVSKELREKMEGKKDGENN